MIDIIFKYKNKDFPIEYNEPRKPKEIFEEFLNSQSLDKDETFLMHKDEKVNLNIEMYIEEQFNLIKKKNKKRLVFFVCKETPFQIIFMFSGKKVVLKVKLNEKMQHVLERLSLKARISLDNIFYLYNAKEFSYEDFGNKTVNDIISPLDREEKLMSITLEDEANKTIVSINISKLPKYDISINNDSDDDSDEFFNMDDSIEIDLLKETEKNKIKKLKKLIKLSTREDFYTKNFLILLIQYIFIIVLTIVGFEYKFNEKIIEADVPLLIKYFPFLFLFFL